MHGGRCVHHLNAHREATWSLDVSADDSLGYFPEESVLAVPHVRFHRLQQKLNFLLAEWKLEGGELLHLCFELVLIWTRREALMIMADIMGCFFLFSMCGVCLMNLCSSACWRVACKRWWAPSFSPWKHSRALASLSPSGISPLTLGKVSSVWLHSLWRESESVWRISH